VENLLQGKLAALTNCTSFALKTALKSGVEDGSGHKSNYPFEVKYLASEKSFEKNW
jgi:hypothetical protein